MGFLVIGDPVPLNVQLADENVSKYARATLLNSANSALSGSPVSLPHITKGNYGSSAFVMPDLPWIKAIIEIFDDSGFTSLSNVYGTSSDIFYRENSTGGGGGGSSASACPELQADIIQTSDIRGEIIETQDIEGDAILCPS
jgi:hypothetical protein